MLNLGGLRFTDECCRHKALDLIGDLALLGRPLMGHVVAEKAGHAMHFALVKTIMSDPTLYEVVTSDQLSKQRVEIARMDYARPEAVQVGAVMAS